MPGAGHTEARRAAEQAARLSYGRLLAWLAREWRDVTAAEDALAEAFRKALEAWPERGIPDRPEAWLLTVARRSLIRSGRSRAVHAGAQPTLEMLAAARGEAGTEASTIPDERLRLMFVCAHPDIDEAARTPLMLQAVLGLDAARIASAFLVHPATMSQRLVRAKTRIREAGLAFAVPERADMPERLDAVLQAVYAAFGSGWDDVAGAGGATQGLAEEAIWLGRVLVDLLPGEPEPRGLLALMLHCEARRPARRMKGEFVPLVEQDPELWIVQMIAEAERHLGEAGRAGRLGRFQLEAAIQSVHAGRGITGRTDWENIAVLYEGLAAIAPTLGVLVARAAARAEAYGPDAGLALLAELPADRMAGYQPYWAARAHMLARLGRIPDASEAYSRAAGLTDDPAVRTFLLSRSPA
jgi:RNA polymerase sigma-70 factor (ECF subfamily)